MDIAIQEGILAWEQGELLRARGVLNSVLQEGCPAERQSRVREILTQIADRTIFSPDILPDDPLVFGYRVAKGDTLSRIARKHDLTEELISSINRLSAWSVLRPGHRIKVVRGPFSATVVKSDHEMHLYLQDVYVRTCRVALGTDNKTPTGKWVVTTRLRNPSWVDPRNGKRYGSTDPDNPLGGYWIALKGIEGSAVGRRGYGIHGTNDEASIGTDASLGCVRLGKHDIEAVYPMLARNCIVTIIESGQNQAQIRRCLGVSENSVLRSVAKCRQEGVEGLCRPRRVRGASVMTAEVVGQAQQWLDPVEYQLTGLKEQMKSTPCHLALLEQVVSGKKAGGQPVPKSKV